MVKLPENLRDSQFLTSQHLEQLADVQELPLINPYFEDDRLKNIYVYYSLSPDEMDAELHRYAAELLTEQKVNEAWQVLLSSAVV